MKKLLRGLGIVVSLLFFIFLGLIINAYFSARAQVAGELTLSGLQGQVTITRDENGVPHINAERSDNDALFGLGFVHAQDRLWQMDFQRHVVQGRLAELFGKTVVPTDKFLRTLGLYRAAQQDYESLSSKSKELIHSYAMGVNAYLERGKKPLEFRLLGHQMEPWDDVDVIAFVKIMSLDLQYMWKYKVRNYGIIHDFGANMIDQFFPSYPQDGPLTLTPTDLLQSQLIGVMSHEILPKIELTMAQDLAPAIEKIDSIGQLFGIDINEANGSNEWAISGKLTKTGKPILCNDPHLAYKAPGLWYLADLKGPSLHVIGATIPGMAAVILGRNDHIAWGMTNVNVNSMDYYRLPADTVLKSRTELIRVKGDDDVSFDVQVSDYGPIVNGIIKQFKNEKDKIAYKWTVTMSGDTSAEGALLLSKASNWEEFLAAIAKFSSVVQNVIYADDQGNIGYHMIGDVPIRNGWSGETVVPADPQHQWQGFIPFSKLPFVLNPERGYIVNSNNKVTSDQYPFEITWNWPIPPYRIMQLTDMIDAKIARGEKLFKKDMVAMQGAIKSYFAKDLLPLMLSTKPMNDRDQQALDSLAKWDLNTSMDSVGATIFNVWYTRLNERLIDKRLNMPFDRRGVPLAVLGQLKNNGDLCKINDQVNGCATLLSKTLDDAVNELSKRYGKNMNTWRWGKVHKTIFKGLGLGESKAIGWIWNRRIPTPGANFTPFMGSYRLKDQCSVMGPGYREIVDFADLNSSLYTDAFGATGNPMSSHYGNMIQRWRDMQYLPMSGRSQDWGRTNVLVLKPS